MQTTMVSSLIAYLEIIVKWRKVILRNVVALTMGAAIITLLLTSKYTATTTMLPPSQEQNMMFSLMSSGLPGGLSSIPGISSILPGLATPSDLYAAILRSGRIRSHIIKKHKLKDVFGTRTMYDTYNMLNEITRIKVSPEGIVSVSVTYKNKNIAADIANSYLEELDTFNTITAMTAGKKYRMFVENRLEDTSDSLAHAEEAFRNFQEKYRTIALAVEIENTIATIAELRSRIILLEVQKGALSSSSQYNNPYLHNVTRELKELKKQLSKIEFGDQQGKKKNDGFGAGFSVPLSELPEVSLEYARLMRDVKIQEAVFELLTQQYEQAKIMELKDTPTVEILDYASPPERRSFPKRSVIVIIVFIASIAINVLGVFAAEYIKEQRLNQKSSISRFSHILNDLKEDLKNLKHKLKKK